MIQPSRCWPRSRNRIFKCDQFSVRFSSRTRSPRYTTPTMGELFRGFVRTLPAEQVTLIIGRA